MANSTHEADVVNMNIGDKSGTINSQLTEKHEVALMGLQKRGNGDST